MLPASISSSSHLATPVVTASATASGLLASSSLSALEPLSHPALETTFSGFHQKPMKHDDVVPISVTCPQKPHQQFHNYTHSDNSSICESTQCLPFNWTSGSRLAGCWPAPSSTGRSLGDSPDRQLHTPHSVSPVGCSNSAGSVTRPPLAKWRRACSFYLRGHCKKEDCEFAHDLSKVTCKFWEAGECFKGDTCPFLHGYPVEQINDSNGGFPQPDTSSACWTACVSPASSSIGRLDDMAELPPPGNVDELNASSSLISLSCDQSQSHIFGHMMYPSTSVAQNFNNPSTILSNHSHYTQSNQTQHQHQHNKPGTRSYSGPFGIRSGGFGCSRQIPIFDLMIQPSI
ncbi:unnamed protein product [Protopolystoma xenopodis]|uniref:C3H1-type domain-containing protein n=1 Tax=Protopolystoma xenopodis TaxID=117903 RepID=A0A3S4ZW84_9PLAT|nr:unnamed protein product [Protopolystoma xenopodis]